MFKRRPRAGVLLFACSILAAWRFSDESTRINAKPVLTTVYGFPSAIRRMLAPFESRIRVAQTIGHPAPSSLSVWRMGFAVAISILHA
jgi:hypothetical protein